MSAWQIWKRLLWKELREGWLPLLIIIVAPAVLFSAARAVYEYSPSRTMLNSVAAFGPPLIVAFWAASKSGGRGGAKAFAAAHLPSTPLADWLSAFAAPALVSGFTGALYGRWSSQTAGGAFVPLCELLGAIYFASIFMLCRFLSRAFSMWPAVAAGAIWTFWNGSIFVAVAYAPEMVRSDFVGLIKESIASMRNLALLVLAASAVGSLAFGVFLSRQTLPRRRIVSLSSALIAALAVGVPFAVTYYAFMAGRSPSGSSSAIYTLDGSIAITTGSAAKGRLPDVLAAFVDKRLGLNRTRSFSDTTRAIGLRDRRYVYLVSQKPDEDRIHILVWDAQTDRIREAMSFYAGVGAMRGPVSDATYDLSGDDKVAHSRIDAVGAVSPDGKHALIYCDSPQGDGLDLWLASLRDKTGKLIIANTHFARGPVVWTSARAIVSGEGPAMDIHLKTATAKPLPAPAKKEAGLWED
ncbi:MAG: hypothetical protein Q7T82_03200 [Armatimonadota bacterium]|nr:hypothetical protein [Armatimonadota bacterium]